MSLAIRAAALFSVALAADAQPFKPPLCPDAANTVELGECLRSVHETADARLNETYQSLIGKLRASAASSKEQSGDPVRALRVQQRAWIGRRDRECKAEYDKAYPGTAAAPNWLACKIHLTRERTGELAQELAELDGKGAQR